MKDVQPSDEDLKNLLGVYMLLAKGVSMPVPYKQAVNPETLNIPNWTPPVQQSLIRLMLQQRPARYEAKR